MLTFYTTSFAAEGRPDQYINDIGKDSGGCIWTGGCHNLKRFDPHDGTVRLYPVPGPITAILEKAPEWMWIGTGMGLYLLDGHGGTCRHIAFPVEAVHVYALYQAPDGLLYIGTGGAGLLVYDSVEDRFVRQYQTENCALISNNIHTIVPRADGTLLLGTENSWPCSGVRAALSETGRQNKGWQAYASMPGYPLSGTGKASCSGVTPEPSCSPPT